MSIRVLFFGILADSQGTSMLDIHVDDPITLADVLRKVAYDDSVPCLVAVNQQQQHNQSMMVHDGDEVAIMPPFSGG